MLVQADMMGPAHVDVRPEYSDANEGFCKHQMSFAQGRIFGLHSWMRNEEQRNFNCFRFLIAI